MTWSIVARDAESGAFGVAVTSKFFAVGALCPYAQSGVGALATQALVNPTYGRKGLALLAAGAPAEAVVATLIAADPGRAARQLHVIDAAGGDRRAYRQRVRRLVRPADRGGFRGRRQHAGRRGGDRGQRPGL